MCVCDCLVIFFIIYLSKLRLQTGIEPFFSVSNLFDSKFWTDQLGLEILGTVEFVQSLVLLKIELIQSMNTPINLSKIGQNNLTVEAFFVCPKLDYFD